MYNIINVIWEFITGKLEFADKGTAAERYAICQSCELRNTKINVCTVCGCYCPAKTKLKKASCPIENW